MRHRRACMGEMVQIDGSENAWFEGRAPARVLLIYIDDAGGDLMGFCFTLSEDTFSYFLDNPPVFDPLRPPASFPQR